MSDVFPAYLSPYVLSHKAPVRCSAFHSSLDGVNLLATGSEDGNLRILDLDKVASLSTTSDPSAAILRSYFDHDSCLTDIAFHPYDPFVFVSTVDAQIRIYEYQQKSQRRCYQQLFDNMSIRSISLHPSGLWLLAATDDIRMRCIHLPSLQSYTSESSLTRAQDEHNEAIRMVRYNQDGSMYLTASSDGSVKIWDSHNMSCIHTISNAHSNTEVCSAVWSPASVSGSSSFILTCGKDDSVKSWDVGSYRLLHKYIGAEHHDRSTPAVYDTSGRYVFSADEITSMITVWNADHGHVVKHLSGHTKPIRTLASHSQDNIFVSGGEDGRMRLWTVAQTIEEPDDKERKEAD